MATRNGKSINNSNCKSNRNTHQEELDAEGIVMVMVTPRWSRNKKSNGNCPHPRASTCPQSRASTFLSLFVYLSISLSLQLFISLSLYLSISLSLYLSISLSLFLKVDGWQLYTHSFGHARCDWDLSISRSTGVSVRVIHGIRHLKVFLFVV